MAAGTAGSTLKRERWQKLLEEVEATGSICAACKATGIARSQVYRTRDESEEFRGLLVAAQQAGVEAVEATLQKRAIEGLSDTAIIFFLKTRKPEVYGDKLRFEEREKIRREARDEVLADLRAEIRELPPAVRKRLMAGHADAA
jgi:hypothetical protein